MSDIQTQLAAAIGLENVSDNLPTSISEVIKAKSLPACVASPATVKDLSKAIALANQNEWRILTIGQGSKLTWGGLAENIDVVISTAKLNQIIDHAVGDFTVTVQPGIKLAELQRVLAEKGQFLATDPAFFETATLGGLVATADAGSLRQRYGGVRDMLIGIQFARYDGELARAGGKVVKNVAGYDLMKLMTGAYGTLGVLSELTFRLYPQMSNLRSLILSGPLASLKAAAAEIRYSGLTPIAFDVISKQVANALLPESAKTHAAVVRFQGVAEGVAEQAERVQKMANTHNLTLQQLEKDEDEQFWRNSAELIRADCVLCKVGLKPSAIPSLLALIDDVAPQVQARLYGSVGLGWLQAQDSFDWIEKVRSHCEQNSGFLTILQAPKSLKEQTDVWGYSGNAIAPMRSIKGKFDPKRLLSPGRFVDRI